MYRCVSYVDKNGVLKNEIHEFPNVVEFRPANPSFTLVQDTTRVGPDRIHPTYLRRKDGVICDQFGNPITLKEVRNIRKLGLPYHNRCWNCGSVISSLFCKRAEPFNMGFECRACGKDLSEYYSRRA